TLGRRRAKKGSYRLTRGDLDSGLPDCLAILIPPAIFRSQGTVTFRSEGGDGFPPRDRGCGRLDTWHATLEHARFVAARFPGRAWIAAELLAGPNDGARLRELAALSESSGLPLAAAGDVHMHVRSRRPLQDVLTAIRLGVPVGRAGYALHPNAERHLRHP